MSITWFWGCWISRTLFGRVIDINNMVLECWISRTLFERVIGINDMVSGAAKWSELCKAKTPMMQRKGDKSQGAIAFTNTHRDDTYMLSKISQRQHMYNFTHYITHNTQRQHTHASKNRQRQHIQPDTNTQRQHIHGSKNTQRQHIQPDTTTQRQHIYGSKNTQRQPIQPDTNTQRQHIHASKTHRNNTFSLKQAHKDNIYIPVQHTLRQQV